MSSASKEDGPADEASAIGGAGTPADSARRPEGERDFRARRATERETSRRGIVRTLVEETKEKSEKKKVLNSLYKPKCMYERGVSRDRSLDITAVYCPMSMYMCECRALCVSVSLGPVSYMRTEAPYLLGYSEPLCFSGPTPAQLRLRFGTPTGPKYCVTSMAIGVPKSNLRQSINP